ncbi:hypothetical protein CDL15_Pgr012198 [Punica granatum]|nr:hypothetical protein CDL15_Pgr012198 [Punica granatum]
MEKPQPGASLEPDNAGGEAGGRQVAAEEVASSTLELFRCEFCLKEFSSGKALGGHKRIHSQPRKKQQRKAKRLSNQFEAKVEREPITTCPYCKKEFDSEKAMSGHLKVHKDRVWKGIQAPEGYTGSVSPNPNCPCSNLGPVTVENLSELKDGDHVDNESVVDAEVWPMVSGRTDSSLDDRELHVENSEDDKWNEGKLEDEEVAEILLMFGNNPSRFSSQLERDAETDRNRLLGSTKSLDDDHTEDLPPLEASSKIQESLERAVTEPEKIDGKKPKKKKKKVQDLETEAVGGDDDGNVSSIKVYNCEACNRTFTSRQAYGGHVSSHNKVKKITRSPAKPESAPASIVLSGQGVNQGQSLSDSRGNQVVRPWRYPDIDLNEPPAEEEEKGHLLHLGLSRSRSLPVEFGANKCQSILVNRLPSK